MTHVFIRLAVYAREDEGIESQDQGGNRPNVVSALRGSQMAQKPFLRFSELREKPVICSTVSGNLDGEIKIVSEIWKGIHDRDLSAAQTFHEVRHQWEDSNQA